MQFLKAYPLAFCFANAAMLAACSAGPTEKSSAAAKPASLPALGTSPHASVAVARNFLLWYRRNYERLGSISIVPASVDEDTANVYAVDFDQAGRYLKLLRSSGFFSEIYLANELAYMHAADSTMHLAPRTDGPPEGFDYDRIVYSQDPESDLEKLTRTTPVVTSLADSARVLYPQLPKEEDVREGSTLEFDLTKHGSKWLIDDIHPIFPR